MRIDDARVTAENVTSLAQSAREYYEMFEEELPTGFLHVVSDAIRADVARISGGDESIRGSLKEKLDFVETLLAKGDQRLQEATQVEIIHYLPRAQDAKAMLDLLGPLTAKAWIEDLR